MTDSTNDDRRHLNELMSNAKVAMLTTTTAEGKQVSRPMGLQEAEFDGDLWFFAYEDSAKVTQIKATPEVNVSFSDTKHSSWTSIAGRAEIVHDHAKAEELYTATLKAWFPEGLETPGLTLIKVHADTAEYWEGPSSTVAFVIGTVRAAVTKNPDNDPITNDTVQL
jgi:general stress protein 26